MTANGYGISFWGDENFMKLDGGDGCTLNILKTTEQSTLKGLIVWYVNCISRELIF